MKDFGPISLCNFFYKIISKALANRLKPLLPQCISQEQSAFVEGRSILDNALSTSKIIHHMKCKTRRKHGEVACKIDISKLLIELIGTISFASCIKWALAQKGWVG